MKKVVALLLALIMCSLTIASCNVQEQPTTTQPITTQPPEHVHMPGAWVTITAPSCKDGEQCQFCATCGMVLETAPIAATGVHKEVVDEAVAPTCTSTGLTEGLHCMSCGKIFVAQVEIPKIAHSYDDKNDATCNTCDFVRDVTCKHTDVTKSEAKEATCTEAGITEGIVCNGCEEVLQKQEIIEALGHNEIIDAGYAATCTTAGLTDGKHCDRCGEVLLVQSYIKELGHKESDWVIEKAPTETEDGYKYKKCNTCNQKTQEEIIPFIGDLGLDYTVNSDGKTCTITGIGTFEGAVLNIPDYIRSYKVTVIGDGAFYECSQLAEINIPETVYKIGNSVFYGCTGLTEITIPTHVQFVGADMFKNADNLHTLYWNADCSFSNSEQTSFIRTSTIKKVVFGCYKIPFAMLYYCTNITEVEIKDTVRYIDASAFSHCTSLASIVIPDSVIMIGSNAFEDCRSLTSVEIPDSVTIISDDAFKYCTSLTSIIIPASVTSMDRNVFFGCTSLVTIEFKGTVKQWNIFALGESWNYNVPATEVVCSDGVITLD